MRRFLGLLVLVALGLVVMALQSGLKATGHHDTALRPIDGSVAAASLEDGAWITARGHIDVDTVYRTGQLVAFRLQERQDGLVFVVRIEPGSPFEDKMLWKRAGLLGKLMDATKKAALADAGDAPEEEPAPIAEATSSYLLEEHVLTGTVFAPGAGMNTDVVHVGAEDMKLTGMFGSYSGATNCPSPLRAVVVGQKPPTRGEDLSATIGYAVGALAALALLGFLVWPARSKRMEPRGPQIAGEDCEQCDGTIVVEKDGVICATCTKPVHARCLGAHATAHIETAPYRG